MGNRSGKPAPVAPAAGPNPALGISLDEISAWSNRIKDTMEPGATPPQNITELLEYVVEKKAQLKVDERAKKRKRPDSECNTTCLFLTVIFQLIVISTKST